MISSYLLLHNQIWLENRFIEPLAQNANYYFIILVALSFPGLRLQMNTTLYLNQPGETYNLTNLHLEPQDYQNYYVNIDLFHQYGISYVAELHTLLLVKRSQGLGEKRKGCFCRL